MVAKLSTTINKIQNLSNSSNSKILIEFLTYMKNNGSSERHQNNNNSYNNKRISARTTTIVTESLAKGKNQQVEQRVKDDSHRWENRHSKIPEEKQELDIGNLKPKEQEQIKEEELKIQEEEQQILLKQNQQTIIDFLLDNKDSIRVEDLKIYEPVYKCYREKGNCKICNSLSNIICISCSNYKNEIWLCTSHWEQHAIEKHTQLIG